MTNRNTSGFSHFIQRHSTCFERLIIHSSIKTYGDHVERELSNPVPLPDRYFDSFSLAIVFGDMAIVLLFLLFFFLPIPDPAWKGTGSLRELPLQGIANYFLLYYSVINKPDLNSIHWA